MFAKPCACDHLAGMRAACRGALVVCPRTYTSHPGTDFANRATAAGLPKRCRPATWPEEGRRRLAAAGETMQSIFVSGHKMLCRGAVLRGRGRRQEARRRWHVKRAETEWVCAILSTVCANQIHSRRTPGASFADLHGFMGYRRQRSAPSVKQFNGGRA
jgi:hypothetical protein